jgi:hypothetical protein
VGNDIPALPGSLFQIIKETSRFRRIFFRKKEKRFRKGTSVINQRGCLTGDSLFDLWELTDLSGNTIKINYSTISIILKGTRIIDS